MISLKDRLDEALFSKKEKTGSQLAGPVVREEAIEFLSKHSILPASSIKNMVNILKSGEVIIRAIGKVIPIYNCEDTELPAGIHFTSLRNCTFELYNCPNLETIEGLFAENCVIENTSISIYNCPKLKSLQGLPKNVDGDFTCTNCPSITSLDGAPETVSKVVSIRGLGRKFKSKEIQRHISVNPSMVFGESEDEEEATLFEAFNDGRLQMIWNAYVKAFGSKKKYKNFQDLISHLVGGWGTFKAWDQFTGRNITTLNPKNITAKEEKLINDMFSTTRGTAKGILVGLNNNELVFILSSPDKGRSKYGNNIRFLTNPKYDENRYNRYSEGKGTEHWWYERDYNDLTSGTASTSKFYNYEDSYKRYTEQSDMIIAVVIEKDTGYDSETFAVGKKQMDRKNAREGMIKPGDVEQYKKMAEENVKRYKDILAKRKAFNTADFAEIDSKVDISMKRVNLFYADAKRENPQYKSNNGTYTASMPAYYHKQDLNTITSRFTRLMNVAAEYSGLVINMRDEKDSWYNRPGGKVQQKKDLDIAKANFMKAYEELKDKLDACNVPMVS